MMIDQYEPEHWALFRIDDNIFDNSDSVKPVNIGKGGIIQMGLGVFL